MSSPRSIHYGGTLFAPLVDHLQLCKSRWQRDAAAIWLTLRKSSTAVWQGCVSLARFLPTEETRAGICRCGLQGIIDRLAPPDLGPIRHRHLHHWLCEPIQDQSLKMERVLQRSDYHRRPHFDNVHFRHNPRRRDKSPRWLLHLWTGHRATGSQSVTDSLHNND